ncbi:SulP family inorganic anion transporter [Actinomadura xylanilytica]|uniref:SulP family inorganic anion transporter n=1 Tax=Actinomadura xylanilytica TaxID=887459 RepID=UPI00255A77F3|nr:SulP family inorganic anion transporter [Actinomadura xylanilytica]MDL4775033.1 SulP family inorganic anion transporter [Actinomadura xylanilytica]
MFALRRDLLASFVVFLVAIPLSLGIAVASGAPIAAGLIAAIVGGVVAGLLGGSPLQVSGPAAGLTVIVADLIQTYGWRATCTITLLGGLLQLGLGACRVARTALAVSPAVVHGMLAGVGVVLVLAQVHVVLGGTSRQSALHNLQELPRQLVHPRPHPALLGLLTIAVLVAWARMPRPERGPGAVLRWIPGPLPAIALATLTAWALDWHAPRVDLPSSLLSGWRAPVLPDGPLPGIVGAVVSVGLVAAVESLLCSVAIDRARPEDVPRADLDRELLGQGAANAASGLLGGLPIAGVIVRSTANLEAGARTRASTVLHGVWVLVLALSCGPVIEQVPLAALAALLVLLGAKMIDTARVRDLRHHREAPAYFATLGGVVALGLGEGVLLGIGVMAVMALRRLTRLSVRVERFDPGPDASALPARWHVVVEGTLTFLGVPKVTRVLQRIPAGTGVDLDLNVDFMDNAAFDAIHQWRLAHERQGGRVDIDEVHETWYERAVTGDMSPPRKSPPQARWWAPWANRRRRNETTTELDTPEVSPSALLLAGVREYHGRTARLVRPIMAELAFEQKPEHLFITCVDSRVVPNIITASGPGDLFINRNVGNLVPRHGSRMSDDSVAATVEYATRVLGIRTITVCGHSNCGAMAALLAGGTEIEHLTSLSRWLKHGNHSLARFLAAEQVPDESPLARLCQVNVMQQLDNLLTYPWIRDRVDAGELELVGLYLDLESAQVQILDRPAGVFVAVPDETPEESRGARARG